MISSSPTSPHSANRPENTKMNSTETFDLIERDDAGIITATYSESAAIQGMSRVNAVVCPTLIFTSTTHKRLTDHCRLPSEERAIHSSC